ncbi:hypothetical protein JNB84_03115 [Rhizobium pusense]|uniref:Uncharacterized protein n=1 Tax=Agrobacterium tumefaciens TaxID=358 RepID=A0AAW8LRL9_AGRTU|nr:MULTISPECIES: hypothetical protein [Agrobacterium]MBP2566819.1 hypothetical protein [Agrobacterium tumefaciens]MBW9076930.1 hypothetical protein [Agrobacterium pusense]MDR6700722.1 hypothetical protein [Agrobacterium tumefaciens]
MKQLDLFQWADSRPSAEIIDIMPAVIKRICAQPHPFPRKDGEVVPLSLKRSVA